MEKYKEYVKNNTEETAQVLRGWFYEEDASSDKSEKTKFYLYGNYNGVKKAAVFLMEIGVELSVEVYKYLREEEIEWVSFEIARTQSVPFEKKEEVLKEFEYIIENKKFAVIGGIDLTRELLEKSLGTQKAIDIIDRMTQSLQVRPFDFIRRCDPVQLFSLLQKESTQTIALILSYLEPNKAAIILQNLPSEIQSNVSQKIACMNTVDVSVLLKIERYLEKKLSSTGTDYVGSGGVEAAVEILNLVDRASERQIIETLEDEDPELAEAIKERMFTFKDIAELDDRAIQKIMREIDSQELAKALKASGTKVQHKIFKNMSRRAAAMLKEDMEYMGPVRLIDVEHAQKKILSVVRHLEDCGEIVVARRGQDDLICESFDDDDIDPEQEWQDEFYRFIYSLDDKEIKYLINKAELKKIKLAFGGFPDVIKKFLKQLGFFKRLKFKYIDTNSINPNATVEAQKELVAIIDLYRESKEELPDDTSADTDGEVLKA